MENERFKLLQDATRYECLIRLNIRSVCVYLGSNEGKDPTIAQAVWTFGAILAANKITLICGGGGRGLMRLLVESVIAHGGYVIAVTPRSLIENEGGNDKIQNQIVVDNMHQRKMIMFNEACAFIAFPGGIGTLEELVEQLTWRQLGHHNKPICIYNHNGFWDPQLDMFHRMRRRNLITEAQPISYTVAHTVDKIIPVMCGEMESCGRVIKRPFDEKLFAVNAPLVTQPTGGV